jgi:hypothetical protein
MLCHPRIVARTSVEGPQSTAMSRHSSARSRQRCARRNGFGMIPSRKNDSVRWLCQPPRRTEKSEGYGLVPVPAFHTIAGESQPLITGSRVGYLLGDRGRSAHGERRQRAGRGRDRRNHPRAMLVYASGRIARRRTDACNSIIKIRRPSRNSARKATSGGGQHPRTARRNRA